MATETPAKIPDGKGGYISPEEDAAWKSDDNVILIERKWDPAKGEYYYEKTSKLGGKIDGKGENRVEKIDKAEYDRLTGIGVWRVGVPAWENAQKIRYQGGDMYEYYDKRTDQWYPIPDLTKGRVRGGKTKEEIYKELKEMGKTEVDFYGRPTNEIAEVRAAYRSDGTKGYQEKDPDGEWHWLTAKGYKEILERNKEIDEDYKFEEGNQEFLDFKDDNTYTGGKGKKLGLIEETDENGNVKLRWVKVDQDDYDRGIANGPINPDAEVQRKTIPGGKEVYERQAPDGSWVRIDKAEYISRGGDIYGKPENPPLFGPPLAGTVYEDKQKFDREKRAADKAVAKKYGIRVDDPDFERLRLLDAGLPPEMVDMSLKELVEYAGGLPDQYKKLSDEDATFAMKQWLAEDATRKRELEHDLYLEGVLDEEPLNDAYNAFKDNPLPSKSEPPPAKDTVSPPPLVEDIEEPEPEPPPMDPTLRGAVSKTEVPGTDIPVISDPAAPAAPPDMPIMREEPTLEEPMPKPGLRQVITSSDLQNMPRGPNAPGNPNAIRQQGPIRQNLRDAALRFNPNAIPRENPNSIPREPIGGYSQTQPIQPVRRDNSVTRPPSSIQQQENQRNSLRDVIGNMRGGTPQEQGPRRSNPKELFWKQRQREEERQRPNSVMYARDVVNDFDQIGKYYNGRRYGR
jgi:hypothetical protein